MRFSNLSVSKSIFVSLGNIFFTVFLWRPLSRGGHWATAHFAPPLKSGPGHHRVDGHDTIASLWA